MEETKKIIFGIIILQLIIFMNLISANRDFVPYGNIKIESSVLNALIVENQTKVEVFISVNKSLNVDTIKKEILSDLTKSEFKLINNLNDSEWFYGELTKEGLEKLKSNRNVLRIDGERAFIQILQI